MCLRDVSTSPAPAVLVVDDDPDIRTLLRAWLDEEGFQVSDAGSGETALVLVGAKPFDLLVMDVRLPTGLDGTETVRLARKRNPDVRSLFISGVEIPSRTNPDLDDFVHKPFCKRELIGCVWELLLREHRAEPL